MLFICVKIKIAHFEMTEDVFAFVEGCDDYYEKKKSS